MSAPRLFLLLFLCLPFAGLAQNAVQRNADLLKADVAFSELSEQRGAAEAFYMVLAEDAIVFPINAPPIRGRREIVDHYSTGAYTLTWTPMEALVAESGELGTTWGTSVMRTKNENGEEVIQHFKYLSVWKKIDGVWKLAADMGNQNPPPEQN